MINFNQSDSHDVKTQLEYLNKKPEYQEDKLRITNISTKPYDFWNNSKIIEFKKRNCEHNMGRAPSAPQAALSPAASAIRRKIC